MTSEFTFSELTFQDLNEAIDLLMASFAQNDPLLTSKVYDIDVWKDYYTALVPKFLQARKADPQNRNLNFVYKKNGKMIALFLGIRLSQFFKLIKPFKISEMEPVFDFHFSQEQKERTIYFDGLCVDKNYMKQGVAFRFFIEISNHLAQIGIIYGIASVYNPISSALFKKLLSTTLFEGISPYYKELQYKIHRVHFRHVQNLKLKPKL